MAAQQAAALGGDPRSCRYWLGRGKAVAGDPRDAQRLLERSRRRRPPPNPPSPQPSCSERWGSRSAVTASPNGPRTRCRPSLQTRAASRASYLELGLDPRRRGRPGHRGRGLPPRHRRQPERAIAHYHLAESLERQGEPAEAARASLRAPGARSPRSPPGTTGWLACTSACSRVAATWRAKAAALGHFQRAAELEPDNARYSADLARALAPRRRLAAAARHYQQATASSARTTGCGPSAATTHLGAGRAVAAADCFAPRAGAWARQRSGLIGWRPCQPQLDDLGDAFAKAETAVAPRPPTREALMCLADVDRARGDFAGAERNYTAAAARSASPAPRSSPSAGCTPCSDKWDRALQALERAPPPTRPQTRSTPRSARCRRRRQPRRGRKAYREAARIAPRQAGHLLALAVPAARRAS